ncbi:MAG: cell division protein FtsA, partial [Bacteroidota bacterium]|nr:cell division protein FtsA [Bacteroidota bacterium]
ELLKIQFGSALGDLAPEEKVVTIPGISGRDPKEISFKSLAYIIQSRMEEILDAVTFEIENFGSLDKLGAGIVLTGGGAMLKHLPQLVRFKTGLDVRIGIPNEHLASETKEDINQTMYATSIGLLLKGYEYLKAHKEDEAKKEVPPVEEPTPEDENETSEVEPDRPQVGFLDNWKKKINHLFEEDDSKM